MIYWFYQKKDLKEEPRFQLKRVACLFGFNTDDSLFTEALKNGKTWLAELQAKERERTVKSLKISFNKIFGLLTEITKLTYKV